MALFLEFMIEQWILVAALLASVVMLISHEARKSGPSLSPQQAINLPIQGAVGEVAMAAVYRLDNALRQLSGARLIMTVHDEFTVEHKPQDGLAVRHILETELAAAMLDVLGNDCPVTNGRIDFNSR